MKIIASEKDEGYRLDVIISRYTCYTRSSLRSRLESVLVNGSLKTFAYRVKRGDIIEFTELPPKKYNLDPEEIELRTIYVDEDIAVIEKPYNMVVHPYPGNWSKTLANALLFNFRGRLSTIGGCDRPGIVHRLDKETSGIMLIALNDDAHYKLSSYFKHRLVYKEYWSVTTGCINKKHFIVNKPIGRNPKNRLKMAILENGKRAVTEFELISSTEKYSLIAARPITGRTHQIRVHLRSVGHPILGDILYGFSPQKYRSILELPEGFIPLFSKKISFPHPRTGEYMNFEIDLSSRFKSLLFKLKLL